MEVIWNLLDKYNFSIDGLTIEIAIPFLIIVFIFYTNFINTRQNINILSEDLINLENNYSNIHKTNTINIHQMIKLELQDINETMKILRNDINTINTNTIMEIKQDIQKLNNEIFKLELLLNTLKERYDNK